MQVVGGLLGLDVGLAHHANDALLAALEKLREVGARPEPAVIAHFQQLRVGLGAIHHAIDAGIQFIQYRHRCGRWRQQSVSGFKLGAGKSLFSQYGKFRHLHRTLCACQFSSSSRSTSPVCSPSRGAGRAYTSGISLKRNGLAATLRPR